MSYSAADFINDCEQCANDYGVPDVNSSELEDCDPGESDGDGLRLLAERVARAMSERQQLIGALKRAEYFLVGQDYLDALNVMRSALKEGDRRRGV